MLRRQHQQIPDPIKRSQPTCSSLLSRIRAQRLRDVRNKYIQSIQKRCLDLFIYMAVLLIFRCPNRLYNAWAGPFPMNLNEFRHQLETNHSLINYITYPPFHRFFYQTEYIQIELGQNAIDQNTRNTLRLFYGHHSYGELLYTYNRVQEPTLDTSDMILYIKFAADEQSYSQQRYPYNFQSFNTKTLRCIVEQLKIPLSQYMHWLEKSIHIEKIEKNYDRNPKVFNYIVIKKCGILIGYVYQPTNEFVFPADSYEYRAFSKQVRLFDTSSSYTPYMSYVLFVLCTYFILKVVVIRIIQDTIHFISRPPLPNIHSSLQKQMEKSNIHSIIDLDNILLTTTNENNYYDRLFIVQNKYLIMFMIELQENNERILRRFFEDTPVIIIPIDIIADIQRDYMVPENNEYRQRIYFPTHSHNSSFNPSNWLHERLMVLNDQYRYTWERKQQLLHDEEVRKAREEEHRRFLAALIEEESQYAIYNNQIMSASPRFIAEFRLADRQIVNSNLLGEICSICLDDFQQNQYFAQWPCTANHTFHFDCMLDVLRAGNTCPLCRFPVEASGLFNSERLIQFFIRQFNLAFAPNFAN